MDIPITRCGKRKLCEIPLYHTCTLPSTELRELNSSQNSRVLESAMSAVADKVILQRGYYQNLLNEPLPKLQFHA